MSAAASLPDNVVPLARARARRMRVVHDERAHLLEQRDDLIAARARLRAATGRVEDRLDVIEAQLAVVDTPVLA